MPFAASATAKLYYEVQGTGPEVILLIQGLGGHASEWGEPFLAPLAERFRVARMDNRGIGQSESSVTQWTMLDMANDAVAVLDALGAQRANVLGTSMGGMIAQQVALAHRARVAKLVLMSTTAGGASAVPPWPEAVALFSPPQGMSLADQRRWSLRVITGPGFAEANAQKIEDMVQLRLRVPTKGRVFQSQLEAIFNSDRSEAVRQLDLPTLVIHGTEDSLVPVGNGKELAARIPGAKLELLEGCGHMPHLEMPARCAKLILDFLAGG
ncbi:MAG TPA: alpha/beta hydrolase [Polyangiales bacterium]|jgi:pimeloyl-ACP methyl ester carboxylesterase|nr:alpha/beta hydrolase [Polyangiales bacterium]